MNLDVGWYCVRIALRNAGFSRRVARRKPPISEKNRVALLTWAIQHVRWTMERWRKYYGPMKHGPMAIGIQKHTLHVKLAKNGTLLVLLSVINVEKVGCFRAVFMVVQRVPVSFGRRNGGLYLKKHIVRVLYLLSMVGCVLMQIKSWFLCRMELLLILQELLYKIY